MALPIVALDFDGVICDSADECMVTSWNAYAQLFGTTSRVSGIAELSSHHIECYRRNRYLVRPAREYGLLWHLVLSGNERIDESTFTAAAIEHSPWMKQFETLFFQTRRDLQDKDPEKWIELHNQYTEASECRERLHRYPLYLVTNKDAHSVALFNQFWNLNIPDENRFTFNSGLSKREALQIIITRNSISPSQLYFVDDHPNHLEDVVSVGVQCRWASWGYHREIGCTRFQSLESLSDLVNEIELHYEN